MAFADAPPITLEMLVDRTSTVYSLPLFYDRLNEAINHPRTSVNDIARIITEDQGLTARLLRLANSPMFGWFGKVDSINRAVTIIGTQQLRDLALAASVMGVFRGIPPELMDMPGFWRHSIACGIIARTLAVWRRDTNVERFFVAGMLHDVGQIIMAVAVPDLVRDILVESRETAELLQVRERQRLGFDHADAGSALLKAWKIPANIVEPVECHHRPGRAEQYPLEAATSIWLTSSARRWSMAVAVNGASPSLEDEGGAAAGCADINAGHRAEAAESQIDTFTILSEEPHER